MFVQVAKKSTIRFKDDAPRKRDKHIRGQVFVLPDEDHPFDYLLRRGVLKPVDLDEEEALERGLIEEPSQPEPEEPEADDQD